MLAWLANPFVLVISARGSADSLSAVLLMLVLYWLLQGAACGAGSGVSWPAAHPERPAGRLVQAAVAYGVLVHWRVYPVIYALPLLLVLRPQRAKQLGVWSWASPAQVRVPSCRLQLALGAKLRHTAGGVQPGLTGHLWLSGSCVLPPVRLGLRAAHVPVPWQPH